MLKKDKVEKILDKGKIIAIILREDFKEYGVHFFTPKDFSQQLGYIHHKSGEIIEAHMHNEVKRNVILTQEVLFIKRGKIRVDFYREDKTYLNSKELGEGDTILLSSGGHGFKVLEDVEMIEVKQGPYLGDADKTRFLSVRS